MENMKILSELVMTPELLTELSTNRDPIGFSEQTYQQLRSQRKKLQNLLDQGTIIYGVNTGLGFKNNELIEDKSKLESFQMKTLFSHATGIGAPLPANIVRSILILKLYQLAQGYSGISEQTFQKIVEAVNKGIIPHVPSQGTQGSSGDLIPHAHLILGLTGHGEIWDNATNQFIDSEVGLTKFNYEPLKLQTKDAICLIEGSHFTTCLAVEALLKAERVSLHADISISMTFEALAGVHHAMNPVIHQIRNHEGQRESASRIRSLILDDVNQPSKLNTEKRLVVKRVQDAYAIRCTPQVHGISFDTIKFVRNNIQNELLTISSTALILDGYDEDEITEVLINGNFHSHYASMSMDVLSMAVHEMGSISERRIERLMNPILSQLPAFLTQKSGDYLGLKNAQVTATSLVSENQVLCHPASSDSLPTSANNEDYSSNGGHSVRKALEIIDNVQTILSIQLICSMQALQMTEIGLSTKKIQSKFSELNKIVPKFEDNFIITKTITQVKEIIQSSLLLKIVKFEDLK